MLDILLLGFIVIIVGLHALLMVLKDPPETINIQGWQASNNIKCFLLYFGVQIFKLRDPRASLVSSRPVIVVQNHVS